MTCIYVVLWNVRRTWHEQRWNDAANSLGGGKQLGMQYKSNPPKLSATALPITDEESFAARLDRALQAIRERA